jgi:hypothetical protein
MSEQIAEEKKANDGRHQGKINRKAAADIVTALKASALCSADSDEDIAQVIVTAIAQRKVAAVSIKY